MPSRIPPCFQGGRMQGGPNTPKTFRAFGAIVENKGALANLTKYPKNVRVFGAMVENKRGHTLRYPLMIVMECARDLLEIVTKVQSCLV